MRLTDPHRSGAGAAHRDWSGLAKLGPRRQGPIDLAILPIGAYDPWIANHASPEQAGAMLRRLEPISRFLAAAGQEHRRVVVTAVGGTWSLNQ